MSEPDSMQARLLTEWFEAAGSEVAGADFAKKTWTADDQAKFTRVLGRVKSALFRPEGSSVFSHPDVRPEMETMALFLLGQLASRNPSRAFWEIDTIRESNRNVIFESQLALLQATIGDGNPELRDVDHLPWANRERLEKKASIERNVPTEGIGKLAHDRLIAFMQRFNSPPPSLRVAA